MWEDTHTHTLPSITMQSRHVRKRGRGTVRETEKREHVSSGMGEIFSHQVSAEEVM